MILDVLCFMGCCLNSTQIRNHASNQATCSQGEYWQIVKYVKLRHVPAVTHLKPQISATIMQSRNNTNPKKYHGKYHQEEYLHAIGFVVELGLHDSFDAVIYGNDLRHASHIIQRLCRYVLIFLWQYCQ